jgi:hypothetical protein
MELETRDPPALGVLKASGRDQYVKVGIELQVPAEGMWNDHDAYTDAMLNFYPMLNNTGTEDW